MKKNEAIKHALTATLVRQKTLERDRRDPRQTEMYDQLDEQIAKYGKVIKRLRKVLAKRANDGW